MSSETTKRQIEHVDRLIGDAVKSGDWWSLTQAKLALVQCLAEQERMERGTKDCPDCCGSGWALSGERVPCYRCEGAGVLCESQDGSAGGGE